MTIELEKQVRELAERARGASLVLSGLSSDEKNHALERIALLLEKRIDLLVEKNSRDLEEGEKNGLSAALIDRLRLTPERILGMIEGVRQVASLDDPVGHVLEQTTRPNGLEIRKVSVPIGVIGIIYESRPNVTIDCAALCLKSGNASILRGGKEAFHSNTALAMIIREALTETSVPEDSVLLIPTTKREALNHLLKLDELVHCIIPRGGEALIRFVAENSRIPVIKHYKGVCNLYVDAEADQELAQKIAVTAKCGRPGVCNAIENLILHKDIAEEFLPQVADKLTDAKCELRGDDLSRSILNAARPDLKIKEATEEDFHTEYLDLILSIKTVSSAEEAIEAVNRYGSFHSDAIVTRNEKTAERFLASVDTSTAYWNASTRFTDGFEFGLGAEIGISTDRLHARGPMGLKELCTYKYQVRGNGQTK